MEIIWTENARSEYFQNLENLERKWSKSVAVNFMEEVDKKLELLVSNHNSFPKTGIDQSQRFLLNKHIAVFYEVKGSRIILLHFWNNYKNPKNLSL
jgi:plasmid stabilization system protein ParE